MDTVVFGRRRRGRSRRAQEYLLTWRIRVLQLPEIFADDITFGFYKYGGEEDC